MSKFFSLTLSVLTVLAYLSIYISPEYIWMAGFFSLFIPVLLVLNFLMAVFYIFRRKLLAILHIIVLLLGFQYIAVTYATGNPSNSSPNFTVLNYNVRVFNTYSHLNKNFVSSKQMINWVMDNQADVKCLQEFYNDRKSDIFNTAQKIRKAGKYKYFGKAAVTNKAGGEFGLAIFSKYRILNKGELKVGDEGDLYGIYIDVKINDDTVRVYNIHLQSMKIEEGNLKLEEATNQMMNIAGKLKSGFMGRAQQIDHLRERIQQCRYHQVVCGDFNDIPYSYTYFSLKKDLRNAFEDAASGFGFSYNGKLFFLRIDNQFYSNGLEPVDFVTHRDVSYSDHFPISTSYKIK